MKATTPSPNLLSAVDEEDLDSLVLPYSWTKSDSSNPDVRRGYDKQSLLQLELYSVLSSASRLFSVIPYSSSRAQFWRHGWQGWSALRVFQVCPF